MDSRVAAIVADILFEIQRVPSIGTDETKDASEDEKCEELLPCSPLDDNRLGINCDDELSRFSEAVEDEPDHCEEEAFIEEENTGVVVGVNDEIENGRVSCWEGTEDSHQGMNDDADSDDTPGATKRPRKRKTFIATDNSTDDPLVENNGHSSNHMEESTTVENSPSLAPSSSPSSVCPSSQPGSPSFTIKKLKKTEEIKERIRDVILKPTGAYSSLNNKNGLLLVEGTLPILKLLVHHKNLIATSDHSIEKVNGIKSRNSDAVLLEESHDREQSPSRPLVNGSVSDCQPTSQTTATSCLF
jgi:hypothetical protein